MSHIEKDIKGLKPVIAVPTRGELEPILDKIGPLDCQVIVTGPGPSEAAMNLTRFFEQNGVHLVILLGLAGAFPESGLRPGELCIATSETFGDLGRCTRDDIQQIQIDERPLSPVFPLKGEIETLVPRGLLRRLGIRSGPMVTVCCTTCDTRRQKILWSRFRCVAENMEGAAVAQVCSSYGAPLLEIRGISNYVGQSDKKTWKIEPALFNLAKFLKEFLGHMKMKGFTR